MHFLWSHYKSLYLGFLGFRIAPPPPCVFSPEATIKVYTWIFFRSHYKSLYLTFLKIPLDPPLISSPNLYTDRVSIAWLVLIFSNFWKTRWPTQPIVHKYCLANYSNAIQAIVSRFDVQVSIHNTLLVFLFFFGAIKLKQNGRLDGTCRLSILTTFDQLKEKLWIYHYQYGYKVA